MGKVGERADALRSVLICHRGDKLSRSGLAGWLGGFTQLSGIVEIDEPFSVERARYRRELRRVGALRFLDVLAFRLMYAARFAKADAEWEARETQEIERVWSRVAGDVPVYRTGSPNTQGTAEFLRACQPQIVLARCKVLLKREIYSVPTAGTYVLHPGMCPEYRNAHGCFWALANRDVSRVACTLLRVDDGIDTGPTYSYHSYRFDEIVESHIRIQARVVTENLREIADSIIAAAEGKARQIDTSGRVSRNYGQPWLTAYLKWKRSARELRRGIVS